MKVILDQLWKQVVSGQGKVTSRLYFDELQVNFTTEEEAEWFLNLWARIRVWRRDNRYHAKPYDVIRQ